MMTETLEQQIYQVLRTIYDPEIPVNVVELGLIYNIEINGKNIIIDMTLTNPACPVAAQFPEIVQSHISTISGVETVQVNLVWDPPWTPERMSEAARFELGLL